MDVAKVAKLAKLSLSPSEQTTMAQELQNIFQWIDALKSVKGEEEEKPTEPVMCERSDEILALSTPESLLSNAPQQAYGMFSVPKVVETV